MPWAPIALTVPQYHVAGVPASGYVLKPYANGTSTPINFATGSSGATEVGSIALNSAGYPEVSGNVVIPHIDQDYKLALYPTQAAADANSGETWSVDNLSPYAQASILSAVAGTNTITATGSPTVSSYTVDSLYWFTPANTNTGAVTLNIDSVGAGAVQLKGAALVGGELVADVPVQVYVTADTPVFEIVSSGTFTAAGVAEAAGDFVLVGDIVQSLSATRAGCLNLNGDTVGSASSGADNASADYADIYAYLWDNIADAEAPVAGGRGASAAADFAADKALTMPDGRGRMLIGADNMGGSSANVNTDSEADTLGDVAGDEEETQTSSTLVGHTHPAGSDFGAASGGETLRHNDAVGNASGSTGSGNALSVTNPYLTVYTHMRY